MLHEYTASQEQTTWMFGAPGHGKGATNKYNINNIDYTLSV
jgi:hypothetical protein